MGGSAAETIRQSRDRLTGQPQERQHSAAAWRDAGPTAPGERRNRNFLKRQRSLPARAETIGLGRAAHAIERDRPWSEPPHAKEVGERLSVSSRNLLGYKNCKHPIGEGDKSCIGWEFETGSINKGRWLNMRSALYYPHTEIQSHFLLSTSLLLWDKVQFIVPYPGYTPGYDSKDMARAVELIGEQHYPTEQEKKRTHEFVEDFVTRQLPDAFVYREANFGQYRIYPEKLLPETWNLLEEANLAARPVSNYGVPLNQVSGLAVMSLLADCCAGSTRIRVTDRSAAYTTVMGLLKDQPDAVMNEADQAYEKLVPVSLKVVDVEEVGLKRLIDFREREAKSAGHAVRDLRHRYVAALETYAKQLSEVKHDKSDEAEILRQFEEDMKDDLANLRDELRLGKKEVVFTREVVGTVLAGATSIAAVASGLPAELTAGALTWAGLPAAAFGGFSVRNKYQAARRKILQNHPMAYIYQLDPST